MPIPALPRHIVSDVVLLCACILCTLVIALNLGHGHRIVVPNLATSATGLYPTEYFADHAGSYQWTNGNAALTVPNPGGSVALHLDLAGGPARTVQARIGEYTLTITPEMRRYHLLLRPASSEQLRVELQSATLTEPQGKRTLGLVISNAQLTGGGVALPTLLIIALLTTTVYVLLRCLGYQAIAVAANTLVAGAGAAAWAAQAWLSPPLLGIGGLWAAAVALVVAMPTLRQTIRRRWSASINRPAVILMLIGGVAMLLAVRMFAFINRYAVNMLFSDEWDFLNPLFRGQGPLEMFTYQHGPHRQGLGGLVLMAVNTLSAWNSRATAFTIGGSMLLAMVAALALKRRISGRWAISDIAIPLIYLTTVQYEALTIAPNPAHGALPALMAPLVPLAWTLQRPLYRDLALIGLNLLMIFTGFGIFMGLIIPALVSIEIVNSLRQRQRTWRVPTLALLPMLGAWALFSVNYHITTASSCRLFAYSRPFEYPIFMALMFSGFAGFDLNLNVAIVGILAGGIFGACIALLLASSGRVVQAPIDVQHPDRTIVILIGFSLLFAFNTALGRMCMGISGGQASRYMPLMTPAFLGLYLALQQLRWPSLRQRAITVFVLLLLPISLPFRIDDAAAARGFADAKQRWSTCYLTTHMVERCDAEVGIAMYPSAAAIQPKLDFLEAHRLNLFAK